MTEIPRDTLQEQTFYEQVGGEETFRRLVHRFYEGVAGDEHAVSGVFSRFRPRSCRRIRAAEVISGSIPATASAVLSL
ncbi:globin domain-containing protein, partial [Streptomyces sp. ZEA17I]|uniref:globin domain-containing protein n=1 Tax=Streptomyces sp. ZEA17I TaxID=2202516 RepID=UPI003F913A42